MRTLVMGDVHGAYKALVQCLVRSGFDYKNDRLIQLGDVVDGKDNVYECVEELLKIEKLVSIKGNHDDWFDEFIKTDFHPYYWNFGGRGTLVSYLNHAGKPGRFFSRGTGFKTALVGADIPETHKGFFASQKLYHIDQNNRCFVHAGFDRNRPFHNQKIQQYYWDRTLWNDAISQSYDFINWEIITPFDEIYIGHTPTTKRGSDKPLKAYNIWNVDTGAGHSGRLTIMDIDTNQFWQSDVLVS